MLLNLRKAIGVITLFAFSSILFIPQSVLAEDHIVTAMDLHQAVVSASQVRQERVNEVNQLFCSDLGKKILKRSGVQFVKVQSAVSLLSDEELARLASQVQNVQDDFAAGEWNEMSWVALGATIGFAAWWLSEQTFAN